MQVHRLLSQQKHFHRTTLEHILPRLLEKRGSTWPPKVCKIMAFMAVIMGLGPLFYILLGFRHLLFLLLMMLGGHRYSLLGPWDLVTTYNWAYKPTYTWGNVYKPI